MSSVRRGRIGISFCAVLVRDFLRRLTITLRPLDPDASNRVTPAVQTVSIGVICRRRYFRAGIPTS